MFKRLFVLWPAAVLCLVAVNPRSVGGEPVAVAALSEREIARAIGDLPWTGAGEKALEVYNQARQVDLKFGDLWAELGLKVFDGGYYPEALEAFRRSSELSPDGMIWSWASLVWQGHVLDILGRREEALQLYREALNHDVRRVSHDQYMIVLDKSWINKRLEHPFRFPSKEQVETMTAIRELSWSDVGDEVIDLFGKAEKNQIDNDGIWFKLALGLYDHGDNAECFKAFGKVVELTDRSSIYHWASIVWQGHILDLQGKRQEALNYYKKGLDNYNDDDAMQHAQYGMLLNKEWIEERLQKPFERPTLAPPEPESELTEAEKALNEKIEATPWMGAGKQAVELYDRAIETGLSRSDLWGMIALRLYDGKYYQRAETAFRKAEESAAEDDIWGWTAVVWQGHLADLRGSREEALKHYRKALDAYKGGVMRHDQYGIVLTDKWIKERLEKPFARPELDFKQRLFNSIMGQKGEDALELYEEARKDGVEDGNLWITLGAVLYDGKHYEKALEAFRLGAEEGSDPLVYFALVWQGHMLDLLGRHDEAVPLYKKGLEKYGGSAVRFDQYGIKVDRQWIWDRIEKPFDRK